MSLIPRKFPLLESFGLTYVDPITNAPMSPTFFSQLAPTTRNLTKLELSPCSLTIQDLASLSRVWTNMQDLTLVSNPTQYFYGKVYKTSDELSRADFVKVGLLRMDSFEILAENCPKLEKLTLSLVASAAPKIPTPRLRFKDLSYLDFHLSSTTELRDLTSAKLLCT